jgi:hypothetical protein
MRLPRVRVRTLMIAVAVAAMMFAWVRIAWGHPVFFLASLGILVGCSPLLDLPGRWRRRRVAAFVVAALILHGMIWLLALPMDR